MTRWAGSTRWAALWRSVPAAPTASPGELAPEFWGASCDADEAAEGGLFSKAVLPRAVLAKSHVPDLAKVMPPFNVESVERQPGGARDAEGLTPQGRVRESRVQQALPGHRPQRVRPDRAPGDLQPGIPRVGDGDRQRGRVRSLRAAALVPVAAGGPHARATRGGARHRRWALQAGAKRDRGVGRPHLPRRAPGTPGSSRSRTARSRSPCACEARGGRSCKSESTWRGCGGRRSAGSH